MPTQECCKNKWGDCCCGCKWQYIDRSHPWTDGGVSTNTRGYICAEPFLGYTSGWGGHGICEAWQKRPERPADDIAEPWDACYQKRDALPTYWRLKKT